MFLPRFLLLVVFAWPLFTEAAKIRFPDEELAQESVLPVFNPTYMVRNRNIKLTNRLELGVSASFALDQPFYFKNLLAGMVSFYFSEIHGVNVMGVYIPPLYSSAGEALRAGRGLATNQIFDAKALPYPQVMGFVNYQYTPYYGKISLLKKFVLNLSIYGFLGPGLVMFNEGTSRPAFNLGIGQKLYFNKWLALRGDVGAYTYYGPRPELANLNYGQSLSFEEVEKNQQTGMLFYLLASVGLVILI